MWINCDELGKSLLSYTKDFFEFGCMIEIGDDVKKTFTQVLVDERTKEATILYVAQVHGRKEELFEVPYQTYLDSIDGKAPQEMMAAITKFVENKRDN